MSPSLSVESLYFSYKEHSPILKDASIHVNQGEVVGLLGRNGSGKPTLFGCLTTFSEFSGSIFLSGRYLEKRKRKKSIAYLPQGSFLPRDLSVDRTLRLLKVPLQDERIDAFRSRRVSDLSGGELRYLEFCIVLSLERGVILLDEPFSKVEPIYVSSMIEKLGKLKATKAILLSDHSFRDVDRVADRDLVLLEGRVEAAADEDALRRLGYLKKVPPKSDFNPLDAVLGNAARDKT